MKNHKLWLIALIASIALTIPAGYIKGKYLDRLTREKVQQIELIKLLESNQEQLKKAEEEAKAKQLEIERLNKELQAKAEAKAQAQKFAVAASKATTARKCEQYRDLVSQYDWPVETALKIMYLESRCSITATNWQDNHKTCVGSFSLFQVGCFWYPHFGYSEADRYNPEVNTAVAYKIWQRSGFNPWTTYAKL